jgi:hypothetical protein
VRAVLQGCHPVLQDTGKDDGAVAPQAEIPTPEVKFPVKETIPHTVTPAIDHGEYDIDGLMNDFPTATELERFVYDQTGIVLNLKGRANRLKYEIGMQALNGQALDSKYLGKENPYVDKAEMIPVEDLKPVPPRDATLPEEAELQNQFYSPFIPHPDPDYRARSKKVHTVFKKYKNGMISYEVIGPIEPRAVGERMDKFGKMRPEIMTWVDPRTGEQVVVRKDGTLTPQGRNLRALMQKLRVNNTNHWEMWVDRDFVNLEGGELQNPWGVEE